MIFSCFIWLKVPSKLFSIFFFPSKVTNNGSSELPTKIFELILKKLGRLELFRSKAVPSSWSKLQSPIFQSPYSQSPWLMIDKTLFFNFADQKAYNFKNVYEGI